MTINDNIFNKENLSQGVNGYSLNLTMQFYKLTYGEID